MGVFCYVQLLCTSSSLLQQQQWALVNASSSSSSSSSPLLTSYGCTHSLVASRLHLHNKQQLLRRRSRSSSSSRSRMMRHSRELGLGLVAMAEEEEEHEEQAEHKKNVNGRVALDRLDEQIRSLSTSDYPSSSSSSSSSAPTRSISSISKLPPPGNHNLKPTHSFCKCLFFSICTDRENGIMLFLLLLLLHWTKSTTLKNLSQVLHEVLHVAKRISRIQMLARFFPAQCGVGLMFLVELGVQMWFFLLLTALPWRRRVYKNCFSHSQSGWHSLPHIDLYYMWLLLHTQTLMWKKLVV